MEAHVARLERDMTALEEATRAAFPPSHGRASAQLQQRLFTLEDTLSGYSAVPAYPPSCVRAMIATPASQRIAF